MTRARERLRGVAPLLRPAALALLAGVFLVAIGGTWLAETIGWVEGERRALRACAWGIGGVGVSVWALLGFRGALVGARVGRLATLALGVLLALGLSELGAVLLSRTSSSPLFLAAGGAEATLARHRMPPFAIHRGSRLNPAGYFDDAFSASTSEQPVVAVLADSFGLGVVTRAENFVQVAEDRLRDRGVWLHNFGVPAIGVPEYALLLEREVRPIAPALVVVCLFPSNDLESVRPARRYRTSLGRWLIVELAGRALVWAREGAAAGQLATAPTPTLTPGATPDATESVPKAEPLGPSFSEETFLRIERARLRGLDPAWKGNVGQLDRLVEWLEWMRSSQPAPIRVVLIPDEFQVSDALHARLLEGRPELAPIDRDAMHLEIGERLRARHFPVLDLLEPLRAGEAEAPTYHLRDTHWNEWGNRIAGEQLARFVEPALDFPRDD